jgi:tetratricopeptide (TPR) repeat protein
MKHESTPTARRSASQPKKLPHSRPAGIRPRVKPSPLERAQVLASKALEASDIDRQLSLAQKALELSSDCADAYTVLARLAGDARQALAIVEQGLAAAERTLGPEAFAQLAGQFWQVVETRPYMRARLALAECLWTVGRRNEAVDHLLAMLQLNPSDNQGVRYLLAAQLIELERDADFERLTRQYPDPATSFLFSQALCEYRRSGDSPASRKLLARARTANRHVLGLLLHGAPSTEGLPAAFTPGDLSEALVFLSDFGGGWRQTPGALTWLREVAAADLRRSKKSATGPTEAAKQQLAKIPQAYGAIWQAAVSRMPTWLRDGELLTRPWSVLIVNHGEHLIVGQEIVTDEPTPALVFDRLARAMRKPLAGPRQRPSEVQVRDEPLWRALQPHLEEIGIDCIFQNELEETDLILREMQTLMRPEGQAPGLVESPTFTSAQGAGFFSAAAKYFLRRPWQKLAPSAIIQIDCAALREFGPGRWYAVVLGQAGQTLGLAVYYDRESVEAACGACCADEARTPGTALSLLFAESFEVPIADLLAAQRHHWTLAGPEAYPLVLCTTGGTNVRPLEPWERQLLEACVRTIPDFVDQFPFSKGPASATLGPVAPSNLKLTLSWAEPEANGCGHDGRHCEV